MAEGGDEWELSKENVQPLRQGRAMSTLQEVLAQQDSASHHAIQEKKQAFELELRFYNGDDPLDVWDRYIKWAEQAFPQGGKESNLCPLLESAVKIFHEEQQYYGDLRYLNICLKFAHFCTEPADLYSYLHSQGIGILHAQLYITWAEDYEARGNYKKADSIFQDGIQRRAEPLEKLETQHKQFQARVSRQILQGIDDDANAEDSEVAEPPRTSLVDLKAKGKNKAKAPINRVGDALKSRSQGSSGLSAPPQQIPSRSRFAVFDENASAPVSGGTAAMTAQPWGALPPARAKENEQKAGPWSSGRPSKNSNPPPSEPPQSLPSFTPYVDEMVQQQTVTPCKINPSVSSVLSARKPGKEEDPLHRLQSNSQGKEEMVMYCKSKVYAGVAEFSFEEIRAEIYMAKIRKIREEERQAYALRRQEMERQIEEMEKQLKARGIAIPETLADQDVHPGQSFKIYCDDDGEKPSPEEESSGAGSTEDEVASALRSITAATLPSCEILTVAQNRLASEAPSARPSDVPFTIFDETREAEPDISQNSMPPPKRRPLAAITQDPGKAEDARRADSIDYIEPLSEEAIVTGSGGNKTLYADPENTSEFIRAAQLASTPFQKDEPKLAETSGQERVPLRDKTLLSDESYIQVVGPKKLSPILEASQEDTRSTVSSVSSVSAGSSCLSASKTLIISEKADLVSQISEVYDQALEESSASVVSTDLQKAILEAMPEVFTSEAIIHEAGPLPAMKARQGVLLGGDSYALACELLLAEGSRLYQTDCDTESHTGAALKVDVRPLPWDFYIVQQLKQRLGDSFQTSFVEQSNCYLFPDGCVALYKDVCLFSIHDIIQDLEAVVEQVAVLLAYNLLRLGEKLHTAEMVHGDLRPETLLLDVELFNPSSCVDMNNCLRLIDFSHSMDLRRCPTLTAQAFPIAQTEHGQQILTPQASPYHVDLLGIANVVHLMLFKKPLQIQQTGSSWKITSEVPRCWNRNLWNNFFSEILSCSHGATADVLKELQGQMMAQLCDPSFEDEVCLYLILLETRLNPL